MYKFNGTILEFMATLRNFCGGYTKTNQVSGHSQLYPVEGPWKDIWQFPVKSMTNYTFARILESFPDVCQAQP